ncbi:MAG: amino acid decarboxylase, partial [Ruminococcus sp.]|nr:amino acid decarboxylase [Ruminococcus sp.]
AAESGYDGMEFAQALRENGVECEYSDSSLVVLLMSPVYRSEDYKRLYHAVSAALKTLGRSAPVKDDFSLTLPKRAMSIREAVFSTSEDIDVENSEGRICGAVRLPCPPAVPIAASGEIIDQNCINIFKRYGIRTVNVVK